MGRDTLPEFLRQLPFFSGPPLGLGMLAAALVLAIMVIPFTSSIAREVLKSVPAAQREGAYALGATRFEAIRAALFYARTGIIGGVMLGFGRALGETMAVTMVIGNNPRVSLSLFAPQCIRWRRSSPTNSPKPPTSSISRRSSRSASSSSSSRSSSTRCRGCSSGACRAVRGHHGPTNSRTRSRPPHDDQCPPAKAALVPVRGLLRRHAVLVALVPLALILFFVVSTGHSRAQRGIFHPHAAARRRDLVAAWATPSSAR